MLTQTFVLLSCVVAVFGGTAKVRGRLICPSNSLSIVNLQVQLVDRDSISFNDLMANALTNENGEFALEGSASDPVGEIDPMLVIVHNCRRSGSRTRFLRMPYSYVDGDWMDADKQLPLINNYPSNDPSREVLLQTWEKLRISHNEFDVLLTDIDEAELQGLGQTHEVGYLSAGSFSSPAFPARGVIHGINNHLMICLVCQRAKKPHMPAINVWFLVETGSPHTYLTEKAKGALFGPGNAPTAYVRLAIQEQDSVVECYPSHGRFAEANLLGLNALQDLNLSVVMNWKKRTFKLVKEE